MPAKLAKNITLAGISVIAFSTSLSTHSDHIGFNPTGQRPSITLTVGSLPDYTAPATVQFNITPALLNTGVLNAATTVLVEAGYRKATGQNPPSTAVLNMTVPAFLKLSGVDTIPITDFSWTATYPGIYDLQLPASHTLSSDTEYTVTIGNQATWIGGELLFQYANNSTYTAGSHTGTITFTASIR